MILRYGERQLCDEVHPVVGSLAQSVVELLRTAPAPLLGPVHRNVGVAKQRLRGRVGLGERNSDAGGARIRIADADLEGLCKDRLKTLRYIVDVAVVPYAGQHDKLVAPEAGDYVIAPQCCR